PRLARARLACAHPAARGGPPRRCALRRSDAPALLLRAGRAPALGRPIGERGVPAVINRRHQGRSRPKLIRDNKDGMLTRPIAAALVAPLVVLASMACNKLDQKECDKIRGDAFEILNKAQHCSVDADCRQSEWPGCPKPLSNKTFDDLKPMAASYK